MKRGEEKMKDYSNTVFSEHIVFLVKVFLFQSKGLCIDSSQCYQRVLMLLTAAAAGVVVVAGACLLVSTS